MTENKQPQPQLTFNEIMRKYGLKRSKGFRDLGAKTYEDDPREAYPIPTDPELLLPLDARQMAIKKTEASKKPQNTNTSSSNEFIIQRVSGLISEGYTDIQIAERTGLELATVNEALVQIKMRSNINKI